LSAALGSGATQPPAHNETKQVVPTCADRMYVAGAQRPGLSERSEAPGDRPGGPGDSPE